MELTWHGHSRFRLRAGGLVWWLETRVDTSTLDAGANVIVLDAQSSADVGRSGPDGMPVVDGPGEYELRGVPVVAVRMSEPGLGRADRMVAYRLEVDGVRVGYVGARAPLASSAPRVVAEVAPVDVAIVPIGDGHGLGVADAIAFARSLEAKAIVPYVPDGDAPAIELVRRLCREIGSDPDATVRALTMTGATMPAVPRVVVLENWAAEASA